MSDRRYYVRGNLKAPIASKFYVSPSAIRLDSATREETISHCVQVLMLLHKEQDKKSFMRDNIFIFAEDSREDSVSISQIKQEILDAVVFLEM